MKLSLFTLHEIIALGCITFQIKSKFHDIAFALHTTNRMRGKLPLMFPTSPMAHRAIAAAVGATLLLGQAQPVFAAFGDGSPTVPNISVFTDPTQWTKVQGSTGAFTQKISVDIPPGRNGLQPDVSLDYNSQRTSDGIVGYGWSLSVPYIERINKTGSQNLFHDTPYFSSSIDGELALATTTVASGNAPSILDTLPTTMTSCGLCNSLSTSYTVPSGGTGKLLVLLISASADIQTGFAATQN